MVLLISNNSAPAKLIMCFAIQYIISALLPLQGKALKYYYTTDGEECLGPCYSEKTVHGHQFKCVTVSDLRPKFCSADATKDFKGQLCLSKCGRETNSDIEIMKTLGANSWCRTKASSYSFCSKTDTVIEYQTIGAVTGQPCISSCGTHNLTSYTWCRTGLKYEDYDLCSYLPNYSTNMKRCISSCTQGSLLEDGSNAHICKDETGVQDLCSPVYPAEEVGTGVRKFREKLPQRNCHDRVLQHTSTYRTVPLNNWNNGVTGSIQDIFVLEHDNQLPSMTYSEISNSHNINDTFPKRDSNLRMNHMQQRYGDERGHIVARQLGGPSRIENMAPMTCKINRAGGPYAKCENVLAKDLRTIEGSRLEHWVYVDYDFSSNSSRRPTNFTVCAYLFDKLGTYLQTYDFTTPNE